MMVIFLVGLVSMILMRTLRKDYARYSKEEDIDEMVTFFWFSLMSRQDTVGEQMGRDVSDALSVSVLHSSWLIQSSVMMTFDIYWYS